ncbi:conserved Plasmodium protein, unknown function [Plasmodium malariae]|uniref:Uncharacterized protein n=1 Tax=Plasmodium malariae TaxID=5858 RepID=A0A1D3SPU4_PLAMA|nr:conserved Plasmodium protein, unknown function [Plasmodium malariae]SCO93907.1 conserved Plasmodium protein, unknown function [Plasmodium malariae]
MKIILLLLFFFIFNKSVLLKKTYDIPLINYEMIPLQRWKVSAKELAKLKENLKIFITSEIQKEGTTLLRKYYKEFYISNENNENEMEVERSSSEKESKSSPFLGNTKMANENKRKESLDINGPILLI